MKSSFLHYYKKTKEYAFYLGLIGIGGAIALSDITIYDLKPSFTFRTTSVVYERVEVPDELNMFDALIAELILNYYNDNEEVRIAETKLQLYEDAQKHAVLQIMDSTLERACKNNPNLETCL